MRLAPVPIAYHDKIELAMEIAAKSSYATHNGIEAAECCRFLTFLLIKLYYYQGENPKKVLDNAAQEFKTEC